MAYLPNGASPQLFESLQSKLLQKSSLIEPITLPDLRLPKLNLDIFQEISSELHQILDVSKISVIESQISWLAQQSQRISPDIFLPPSTTIELLQSNPLYLAPFAQLAILIAVASATANLKNDPNSSQKSSSIYSTNGKYNPTDAQQYFSNKPILTVTRSIELASTTFFFALSILSDLATNSIQRNESLRANQLSQLLAALGPTFIKIGQSLSVRTDLLRPAYLVALSRLQDAVPPFPTKEALAIMEAELGQSAEELFTDIFTDTQTVAAASLGQVYKATLASTGESVAVKIQRPNIEARVALDMHLLRSFAPPIKSTFGLQSDLLGIIDEWGAGFVSELDYQQEARNSQLFMENIAKTPLKDSVFAPAIIESCTSKRILTTSWVEGSRLELSSPQEQSQMCKLAMNTYLTMMLDKGFQLHSDPHLGNLRRTADGKLCILDWGLVTELEPDLQVSMIEHVAHLTSKDYAKVPSDLVKLGFIPKHMEGLARDSGVVEVLTDVYSRFAQGGGAAKIDVSAVINDLSGLTKTYGNLFQLPPYFAYIAKAFGVLEGIGLSNDPDFAIVAECTPYIAKRLITKSDKATGAALKSFIFGNQADSPPQDRIIDPERLELLVRGFESYSRNKQLSSVTKTANSSPSVAEIEEAVDTLLSLLVDGAAIEKSPLQSLLIEETTKLIIAYGRVQFKSLRSLSGTLPNGRSLLGTVVDPLGLFVGSSIVDVNSNDVEILGQGSKVLTLLMDVIQGEVVDTSNSSGSSALQASSKSLQSVRNFINSLDSTERRSLIRSLITKIFNRRSDLGQLAGYFVSEALTQAGSRALNKSSKV